MSDALQAAGPGRIRALCPKNPSPRWPELFGGSWRTQSTLPGPVFAYTVDGRSAIYRALQALDLPPGSSFAMPAYHCPSMVDPVLAHGMRIAYYPVRRDLTIDMAALELLLDSGAKGVLLAHFFGFAAPAGELRTLCDRYGAVLIEDCCHALFGTEAGRPLGAIGDAAVFSFRKTLPVHEGGALIVNRAAAQASIGSGTRHWRREAGLAWRSLSQLFGSSANRWMDLPAETPHEDPVAATVANAQVVDFDPGRADAAMAMISRQLLHGADPRAVRARRVANYNALAGVLAGLPGVEVFRETLGPENSPLGFPFIASSLPRADRVLRRAGVPAFSFGEILHPGLDRTQFSDVDFLSTHLTILPVHQSLSDQDIELLARRTREVLTNT